MGKTNRPTFLTPELGENIGEMEKWVFTLRVRAALAFFKPKPEHVEDGFVEFKELNVQYLKFREKYVCSRPEV